MAEINYIEINAENRSITIPQSEKLLGVENDSKAIRKYFRCPKIVGDGIDLTKSDVHINIQNASNKVSGKDRYNAENLKVSGENVTFEWSPLRKATSHKGTVRFSVCVTEEGTDREWNTTIATLNVLEGEELFTEKEREERGSDFAGILTADATADADSIELGKSAYVNGKKIEGALTSKNEIKAVTKKTELSSTPIIIPNYGQSTMPVLKHTIEVSLADTSKPVLLKGDIKKTVAYNEAGSIYGDAKASDVRVGKTFTSSHGVKVTGTLVTSEVQYGTITGKGMNSQAIETGLSNVSRFIMARKFPSTKGDAGVLSLVYKDGRLSGVSTSSSSMAVVDNYDIGTVAINKGTITYTPKANEKMSALTEGDTYDWIAINE